MNPFFEHDKTNWEDIGDGLQRKMIGYTPDLMAVLVKFEKGAIGHPHTHDIHDQIGYVAAGSFEVEVDGIKKTLKTGDAYIAAKTIMHGAVAIEENSILIDMFNPARQDFL